MNKKNTPYKYYHHPYFKGIYEHVMLAILPVKKNAIIPCLVAYILRGNTLVKVPDAKIIYTTNKKYKEISEKQFNEWIFLNSI